MSLGIVGKKYSIVQNVEAFEFTDELLGHGVKYETAGSLMGGKKIWLLSKLQNSIKLAGDDTDIYLVFYNSHDGKGSVRVFVTPVRVVCNNTLNMALNNVKRNWSTIHVGSIQEKLQEAARTLEMTNTYIEQLAEHADVLTNKTMNDEAVTKFIEELFPVDDDLTERRKNNIYELRDRLYACYDKTSDLQKFKGTAWGILNAVSDFVGHAEPRRNTPTFVENRFDKIVTGHPVFDKAAELLAA